MRPARPFFESHAARESLWVWDPCPRPSSWTPWKVRGPLVEKLWSSLLRLFGNVSKNKFKAKMRSERRKNLEQFFWSELLTIPVHGIFWPHTKKPLRRYLLLLPLFKTHHSLFLFKESISQIFYTSFVRKCFSKLFSSYSLALYLFWQNNMGAKAARKMLVKLTKGVNFTNILWAAFPLISSCQEVPFKTGSTKKLRITLSNK